MSPSEPPVSDAVGVIAATGETVWMDQEDVDALNGRRISIGRFEASND